MLREDQKVTGLKYDNISHDQEGSFQQLFGQDKILKTDFHYTEMAAIKTQIDGCQNKENSR